MLELPPPDPHESLSPQPPDELRLPAPTAVHLGGPPSREADRLSAAILAARPGMLLVAVRR